MKTLLRLLLVAFTTTAAFALTSSPSTPDDEIPRCRKCESTGIRPCPEHDEEICTQESRVHYCSVIQDCEKCAGVGHVDCAKCDNEPAEAALDAERAEVQRWREELKRLDEPMGRELRKAAGKHFTVVWEMGSMKVGKKRFDEHRMLHLTLDRLEALWDQYIEVMGCPEKDLDGRPLVMVWHLLDDHRRASVAFAGLTGDGGVKFLSDAPVYSTDGSKRNFSSDEELHRNLIHNATHLLFTLQKPVHWVGNQKGGWIDEGLAHWFEEQLHGLCTTFCYQEVATVETGYKGGKFKLAMRKLVAMEEAPPLAGLFTRNVDELSGPEHAASLAVVDYLIQLDAAKFNRLGVLMRSKQSTRDALKETFKLAPLVLESRVFEWVLATYPKR